MSARARVYALALAGVIAISSLAVVGAQGKNPHVGTWKLNLAKSQSSSALPKSRMVTIASAGAGADLAIKVEEVGADGTASNWSFTTKGDGVDVPVTGTPRFDAAASTIKAAGARHTVYKKGGKAVLEIDSTVSPDGKTMTTKSKGLDASGKPVTGTSVYERQ